MSVRFSWLIVLFKTSVSFHLPLIVLSNIEKRVLKYLNVIVEISISYCRSVSFYLTLEF